MNTVESSLHKVGDLVSLNKETVSIESVCGNRATLFNPTNGARFTQSAKELAEKKVFVEGLHSEQQASGTELTLVEELFPIVSKLPIQGWFNSSGTMTFKAQDDIYYALRKSGYDTDSARNKAKEVREQHNDGKTQFHTNYLPQNKVA